MQTDVYHGTEDLTYNGTLRGPRPNIPSSHKKKPMNIRLPSKTNFIANRITQHSEGSYSPKTEIDLNDESSLSRTKTWPANNSKESQQGTHSLPSREGKKLPPHPKVQSIIFKKPVYYSSSDEEDNDIDDEEILRDLSLSRKISVDDIKLSDDEDEDEERVDDQPIVPARTPKTPKKTNLPPIPIIAAPESSDEEEKLKTNVPAVPTLVIPGDTSDEEEEEDKASPDSSDLYNSIYYGVRCAGCKKPLSGDAITLSNKSWHPKCLKCQKCHKKLEHIQCYEKDGLPYCDLDYHDSFSPRCNHCMTPIESGRWLTALNKNYHIGHLFCRECGKPFEEGASYSERDGHVYCQEDYQKLFAMKCKGCGECISKEYITALDGSWHKECFVCVDCGCFITSSMFMVKNGKPHCGKNCLETKKKRNPIIPALSALPDLSLIPSLNTKPIEDENYRSCHKCQKIIQGRYSSAFGFDYHPLHFQCSQCNKLLSERLVGLYEETTGAEIICKACVRQNCKATD